MTYSGHTFGIFSYYYIYIIIVMSSTSQQHYPDYLNPFGSDEEDEGSIREQGTIATAKPRPQEEYPDFLSPFGDDDNNGAADDYDDSLNPFGAEGPENSLDEKYNEDNNSSRANYSSQESKSSTNSQPESHVEYGRGNPFSDCEEEEESPEPPPPPVPLPRTKSLLKKEQAQKEKQNQLAADTSGISNSNINSFQRKKNKRNAPPVPINFKRQVSGSLDAIEEELNDIGDELAIIEKESSQCQENLKATHQVDEARFANNRSEFLELVKRKNSIVRRQKELMYRKRELKLDQIHSDIEYELRMIGNKQLSNRTAEDETREKELLQKLVEIVEEKNDIVENLNKENSCDSQEVEDILRRLSIISDPLHESEDVKNLSSVSIKNESCDKSSIAIGTKLSKIATLLPKKGIIKGTMKFKRKRLFKKCDSRPIER